MERHRRRTAAWLVATIAAALSVAAARAEEPAGCAPVLVGIWKPEATPEAQPVFLAFSRDGWVNVLDSSAGTRAADFAILAQASYTLDTRGRRPRIRFRSRRGSDAFPPGESAWIISYHTEDAFMAVPEGAIEGSRWVRVQTHRYFLTFAAGAPDATGAAAAFVMWTKLDGRRTDLEALGVYFVQPSGGPPAAVFGRIPAPLAEAFAREADDGGVMMRIELSEADYHRTHALFERWDERLRMRTLGPGDPFERATEVLWQTADRLNHCGVRMALAGAATPAAAPPDPGRAAPSIFVRRLYALNHTRHVDDGRFPFVWQPPPPM